MLFEETEFGEKIRGVKVHQALENGEIQKFEIQTPAVFEFVGLIPNTDFLKKSNVRLNNFGEICVNEKFQTSSKRIFAVGDAIENAEKQIVIAAASGAKASIEISKILHTLE